MLLLADDGRLLSFCTYACQDKEGHSYLYISTEEIGLYEKYGFSFWQVMQTVYGTETRVYRKGTAKA